MKAKEGKKTLLIKNVNTKTYGKKIISLLRPEISNSPPEHIKVETSFAVFQNYLENIACAICTNLTEF